LGDAGAVPQPGILDCYVASFKVPVSDRVFDSVVELLVCEVCALDDSADELLLYGGVEWEVHVGDVHWVAGLGGEAVGVVFEAGGRGGEGLLEWVG
jgi:hypothetical protein